MNYMHVGMLLAVTSQVAADPVATPDEYSVQSGVMTIIDVTMNDVVEAPAVIAGVEIERLPPNGSATVEADTHNIVYESNDGYSGPDTVAYKLLDDQGNAAVGLLNLTVEAPPVPTPSLNCILTETVPAQDCDFADGTYSCPEHVRTSELVCD